MSSGKTYSLIGVQDTDKAIRHTRLSADERKRLSSLANWKPLGAFSIAGEDSRFLILIRSVLAAFTSTNPNQHNHLFALAKRGEREYPECANPFPERTAFVPSRLMFDCSCGKGKTQIGMAKFQAPRGFGEISTPARG